MYILTGRAGFVRTNLVHEPARDAVTMAQSQSSERLMTQFSIPGIKI